MRFFCRTCPYIYQVKSKVRNEAVLQRKVQDDVLGGPDDWKNAEETDGAHSHHALHTLHVHVLTRPRSRQPTAASAATTARSFSRSRSATRTIRSPPSSSAPPAACGGARTDDTSARQAVRPTAAKCLRRSTPLSVGRLSCRQAADEQTGGCRAAQRASARASPKALRRQHASSGAGITLRTAVGLWCNSA